MSISSYADLQTVIGQFLDRSDLSALIPTFIALAEDDMNTELRHWRMENRAQSTVTQQYAALPTDWLETIRVHFTGSGTNSLSPASSKTIADKRAANGDAAGVTRYFTHTEGQLEFYPTPAGAEEAEILYYQKIPALSGSNASNWVLTNHMTLYLYGSLIHSAPYLKDDERLPVWKGLYSEALGKVKREGKRASASGLSPRLKVRGLG